MSNLIPTLKNGADSKLGLGFRSVPSLATWLDDIFENNFEHGLMSNFNTGMTLPAVNVKDRADDYIVEMAVPGLKKSDFDINLDNDLLSISAEIKTENEDTNDNYTRREFGYSSFKRTFSLPKSVISEKIKATYTDGILTIELPKRDEAKKKPLKQIKVS
jgi:HSP20 family protein